MSLNPISSNTLLTYTLSTLPDPLQVSPPVGEASYAALSLVVSNNLNDPALQLTSLEITLPIGTDAASLTNNPGSILYSCSPSSVWTISPGASAGVYNVVSATGQPVTVTTEGLVIQLYAIAVNQVVGTADITVAERAQGTGQPLQLRGATFAVGKFPYGFYFGQLTVSAPMVADGGIATLAWIGSTMSTYTMKWADQSADVTEVRSWNSPALTETTTFQLIATSVSQSETVTTSQTVTVIVDDPELAATSLVVSGTANLQGATTVQGLTANAASVFQGTATFNNTLTSNGVLNAAEGIFTQLTPTQLILSGTLQGMGSTFSLGQGTYTAQTDGIALAYGTSSGISSSTKLCGWVMLTTSVGTFYAYGGNSVGPASSSSYYSYNDSGLLAVPIQKGQSFSLGVQNSAGTIKTFYFFIPFGAISQPYTSGADAVLKVSSTPFPVMLMEELMPRPDPAVLARQLLAAVQQGDEAALTDILSKIL